MPVNVNGRAYHMIARIVKEIESPFTSDQVLEVMKASGFRYTPCSRQIGRMLSRMENVRRIGTVKDGPVNRAEYEVID